MKAEKLEIQKLPPYLMVLSKNKNGERKSVGTAFLINECWAITAKHVLIDFFDISWPGTNPKSGVKCAIIGSTYNHSETTSTIWNAFEAFGLEGTDIAFLKLKITHGELSPDITFPTLNLKAPSVGEVMKGLGFPNSTIVLKENDVQWYAIPKYSLGNIDKVHPQYRDSSMINFPSAQIAADFQSGMSGGPVLNQNNEVIGVICSGVDESLSYTTLIWPAYMELVEKDISAKIENENCVSIVRDRENRKLKGIAYTG